MLMIHVSPGQELFETLDAALTRAGISEGAIASVIGAVDHCCLSTMPKGDAKADTLTEYREPVEMFGTGMIRDGKPHIHATIGREGDEARAGHLHWARVENWFVDIAVIPAQQSAEQ